MDSGATGVAGPWRGPGRGHGLSDERFRRTRQVLKQSPAARSHVRIGGVFVRQIINWFLLCQALFQTQGVQLRAR